MSPRNARQTSRGRLYEWRAAGSPMDQEPERFWSVTTILKGALPAPNLMKWGMKSVAEYAVANHKLLSQMVAAARLERSPDKRLLGIIGDPDALEGAIAWLKDAPYRERDRKADLGTAVHAEVEAYVLGQPRPEPDAPVAALVAGFRQFLDDYGPEYVRLDEWWMSEATVYNRAEAYAGTLDAILDLPGLGRLLIDYKTGSGVYSEAAMQLAAYRHAEFIGLPDGSEVPMPAVDGCAVLHLQPDGYELIPVIADEQVFTAFRYAREVFRWVEETSKGVIGQPLPKPKRDQLRLPVADPEEVAA